MRGLNCDSDQYLVKARSRQRIAKVMKPKSIKRNKWNTEYLKDEEKWKKYPEQKNY